MSENGGSGVLVATIATGSSLLIGFGAVLRAPSVRNSINDKIIEPAIGYVYQSTIKPVWDGVIAGTQYINKTTKPVWYYFIAQRIPGNEPTALFDMHGCKEPKDYDFGKRLISRDEVSQHISQNCKDIYHASVLAILNEKSKTNKPPVQERLEQKARKAAKKKWQELRLAGSVTTGTVTISTVVLIADIAVAESGGHDERRAN
ncbi:hypothetical protein [Iningainema tapete]|uniref:Uncharacterized protein n=1 Tax=Iningainema tapete BLCC-T55 TaxID=2748662 RepID=A0A8J6XLC2_9CYAN|nr:hypothetical protein [Iningainema tapete]MBD2772552.1 hypothetical protein [Iningainema tapete BLCC-T55]